MVLEPDSPSSFSLDLAHILGGSWSRHPNPAARQGASLSSGGVDGVQTRGSKAPTQAGSHSLLGGPQF